MRQLPFTIPPGFQHTVDPLLPYCIEVTYPKGFSITQVRGQFVWRNQNKAFPDGCFYTPEMKREA